MRPDSIRRRAVDSDSGKPRVIRRAARACGDAVVAIILHVQGEPLGIPVFVIPYSRVGQAYRVAVDRYASVVRRIVDDGVVQRAVRAVEISAGIRRHSGRDRRAALVYPRLRRAVVRLLTAQRDSESEDVVRRSHTATDCPTICSLVVAIHEDIKICRPA